MWVSMQTMRGPFCSVSRGFYLMCKYWSDLSFIDKVETSQYKYGKFTEQKVMISWYILYVVDLEEVLWDNLKAVAIHIRMDMLFLPFLQLCGVVCAVTISLNI